MARQNGQYHSKRKRWFGRLYSAFAGACAYCAKKMAMDKLTVDHWVSLDAGGTHRLENWVLACHRCNGEKSNLDGGTWLRLRRSAFIAHFDKMRERWCTLVWQLCGPYHTRDSLYSRHGAVDQSLEDLDFPGVSGSRWDRQQLLTRGGPVEPGGLRCLSAPGPAADRHD